MLYLLLSLPCMPTIWKVLPVLERADMQAKLMIERQHLLLRTVSWRIGSAVTWTRNTKFFAYAYISGEEFCCFWELSAVAHPLTETPVEGNGTCLNGLITYRGHSFGCGLVGVDCISLHISISITRYYMLPVLVFIQSLMHQR